MQEVSKEDGETTPKTVDDISLEEVIEHTEGTEEMNSDGRIRKDNLDSSQKYENVETNKDDNKSEIGKEDTEGQSELENTMLSDRKLESVDTTLVKGKENNTEEYFENRLGQQAFFTENEEKSDVNARRYDDEEKRK